MNDIEKEKYCIKFMYRILNDKRVLNRFCCTHFGNIEEDKTVRLNDCINYLEKKFEELETKNNEENQITKGEVKDEQSR